MVADAYDTVSLYHEVVGSGPPVLLVAGTGYPGGTWPGDFVRALAETCTVVTFDHRGTGRTPGTDGEYTTRLFALDALALLRDLDLGPAHVLGHSMGGRVAQWMAIDQPESLRSLILVGSGAGARDGSNVHRDVPISTALGLVELGYEDYLRDVQRRTFFTPEFVEAAPEAVRWLGDAFWEGHPPLHDYLKHVVARQRHNTVAELARISTPTLVVVGSRDTHVGGTGSHVEQSEYLADAIDGAELRMVPDAAHGLFWQAGDRTLSILLEWIARHPA